MHKEHSPSAGRIRRLGEELSEDGFAFAASWSWLLLTELDYALRPTVHERRVPSYGAIVEPRGLSTQWEPPTQLHITPRALDDLSLPDARRFADGLSSWLVRPVEGRSKLVVFDRPAGSERDLIVLAEATGGTMVQRHPAGPVRVAGEFGVLRWDGITWHHEPPLDAWIDAVSGHGAQGDRDVLARLLEFAVHDLGARGVGATLVYRPDDQSDATFQLRLAVPPPLDIRRPADLAPLRHVLAQVDGAAVFDVSGVLRQLGVRLVPSAEANADVEGFRGMRHTSGRRYSFDEPRATVIVVSEDGPVTVLRNGELLGGIETAPVARGPERDGTLGFAPDEGVEGGARQVDRSDPG
jgi:hypothetical protein